MNLFVEWNKKLDKGIIYMINKEKFLRYSTMTALACIISVSFSWKIIKII